MTLTKQEVAEKYKKDSDMVQKLLQRNVCPICGNELTPSIAVVKVKTGHISMWKRCEECNRSYLQN